MYKIYFPGLHVKERISDLRTGSCNIKQHMTADIFPVKNTLLKRQLVSKLHASCTG